MSNETMTDAPQNDYQRGYFDGRNDAARLRGEAPQGEQEAVAWIRFCSDGLYEGPIHDSRMEDVRRRSGAWTPLYTRPQPVAVAGDALTRAADAIEKIANPKIVSRLACMAFAEAALSAAPAAPNSPSIVCEHCPTQFHGTEDAAASGGWISGWDGWECPAHKDAKSAAPAPVAGDGRIRFDFTNADGRPDCKIISHDEMRQRYADLREQKEGWAAPVAGDAVAALVESWRESNRGGGYYADGVFDRCADDLETALAQDRASQAGAAGVPEGLLSRLEEAARRVENGHAPRRIPADPSDLDLVLSEVIAWLKGEAAPFWVPTPAADGEVRNGG